MALSLLFIVLRIPIWPRLAKYRATSRARCVQLAFWLFGPLLLAPTACMPGTKIGRITPSYSKKTVSRVLRRSQETEALKCRL